MNQNYCIFAAQYFPHLGGVERYTYHLAKELIRRGDRVVIVTSNVQRLPSYEKMDGDSGTAFSLYQSSGGPLSRTEAHRRFLENSPDPEAAALR